jgi:hypothetical protein
MKKEIFENNEIYKAFAEKAQCSLARGLANNAAVYVQMAASVAWRQHIGKYPLGELENILLQVAPKDYQPSKSAPRILHVMTRARDVGGHTRLVTALIDNVTEFGHNIVLTRQPVATVPDFLVQSGATVHSLAKGDLLQRSQKLRIMAQAFNFVFVHTHPDDATAALAFMRPEGLPPIVFVNHADHVPWLGACSSSVFANIRGAGIELSITRRRIPKELCSILPIPLEAASKTSPKERALAKQQLGLSGTVILSAAKAYKYTALSEQPNFVTVHQTLADTVSVLVIGPTSQGIWAQAETQSQGRVRALGEKPKHAMENYYKAADIYVDSFPVGSITSLIDAALRGIPVLSLDPSCGQAAVLKANGPGLVRNFEYCKVTDYKEALQNLIDNSEARVAKGEQDRQSILAQHRGDFWKEQFHTLLTKAQKYKNHRLTPVELTQTEIEYTLLDTMLNAVNQASEVRMERLDILGRHANLLNGWDKLYVLGELIGELPKTLQPLVEALSSDVLTENLRHLKRHFK